MPCRDYESDSWGHADDSGRVGKLKEQADRLARIACKAMDALEELEKEDFLLLKDDEVREWWQQHKEADRKEKARIAEQERKARIKAEALARLSDEEKELLGLAQPKKPAKKSAGRASKPNSMIMDIEQVLEAYTKEYQRWEDKGTDEF